MTQCTLNQNPAQPCEPPQHLTATHCPRCQWNQTHTLCPHHWNTYQWALQNIGNNCPTCFNPTTTAHTNTTGTQPITYYGQTT